jgi:two-component system chemotaxis sensor kinase CheA
MEEAKLRKAFLDEAEALAQKLGESLLGLEADAGNKDLVNEVFRLVHSLKSESALMGFASLSRLAHVMEDALGAVRDGALTVSRQLMDALYAGSDLIGEMMAAISRGGADTELDPASLISELLRLSGSAERQTPAAVDAAAASMGESREERLEDDLVLDAPARERLAEARDRGEGLYRLTVIVARDEPMKFARAFLVFTNLELLANVLQTDPPMNGAGEPEESGFESIRIYLTSGLAEEDLRAAASIDQISETRVERMDYSIVLARAAGGGAPRAPGASLVPAPAAPAQGFSKADAGGVQTPEKASIRVDTRKLDDLWKHIADLVLAKSHIARFADELGRGAEVEAVRAGLTESFDSLDKISSGMQQAMMDTRMVPISVILNKFPRLVRDLTRKLGKSIALSVSGEETEIDRGIVEALSDPLTHIVRNAIDHGIEFSEERVRIGKPEKGRLGVSARQQGGSIVIEITDDGRGIDPARLRETAIAMGIKDAASLTDAQLLELVFLPGFSTKSAVSDLSGRGVGMDVVATRVRGELKGDVVLDTDPGRGTRVTLLLPLTLTIVNTLLVRWESFLFAIPFTDVERTTKVLNTEIGGEGGRETFHYMGGEIPLHRIGALFGKGRRLEEEHFAVVIKSGDARACLIVEELMDEKEIVIKPIDDLVNYRRLFSGITVLEDGRLVFILDTSFIRRESSEGGTAWRQEFSSPTTFPS